MALRKNKNASEGDAYDYGFTNASGFSIDTFRESNKVMLLIEGDSKPVQEVFRAYYDGKFSFESKMDLAGMQDEMFKFLNGLGPVTRSIMSSLGKHLVGENWSGAFDAPFKPYIKGTSPLSFSLKCVLPLFGPKDTHGNYIKNIETPINNLLMITLPSKSKAFEGLADKSSKIYKDAMDWLFNGTNGTLWDAVQGVIDGLKEDFFGGIYMLLNPAQFDRNNKLILRVGPWRVPDILVTSVKVDYSPLVYYDTKTGDVYPAKADVTLNLQTSTKATTESMNIGDDWDHDKLSQFLPKDYVNNNQNDKTKTKK